LSQYVLVVGEKAFGGIVPRIHMSFRSRHSHLPFLRLATEADISYHDMRRQIHW
jgi:hypothetical protein